MTPDEIKRLIELGIPGAEVVIDGDGRHFQAVIVSEVFHDLSMVKQHQLVYHALGESMQEQIHALSMKTLTPEEWQSTRKFQVL